MPLVLPDCCDLLSEFCIFDLINSDTRSRYGWICVVICFQNFVSLT